MKKTFVFAVVFLSIFSVLISSIGVEAANPHSEKANVEVGYHGSNFLWSVLVENYKLKPIARIELTSLSGPTSLDEFVPAGGSYLGWNTVVTNPISTTIYWQVTDKKYAVKPTRWISFAFVPQPDPYTSSFSVQYTLYDKSLDVLQTGILTATYPT